MLSVMCSRLSLAGSSIRPITAFRHSVSTPKTVVSNVLKLASFVCKRRVCSSTAQVTPKKVLLGGSLSDQLSAGQRKMLGVWLLGLGGMCVGAVTLGGLTRLTESGLSMTEWNLIKDMKYPASPEAWQEEFDKYKAFPEYQYKIEFGERSEMSMREFQFIWLMEWSHRMWGRSIGMAFIIPATAFWARGWFSKAMKKRMCLAGGLLAFQGFLGWYMVKSGLDPSQNSDSHVPRVSQYRLCAHLTSAIVLYTIFLWTGLSHVFTPFDHTHIKGIGRLRALAHSSKTAMFLTAVMGAFVAGLDAGLVYNSWPLMADRYVPSDIMAKQPWYINFTENATTVQFMHRQLAYLTVGLVTCTWLVGRRMPLGPRAKRVLHGLMGMAYLQASLGVATLLYFVPVWMASLHQNGSMALITLAFWLTNELRRVPK